MLGTKIEKVVKSRIMEPKYVFSRITRVRLSKELDEICIFTM